MSCASYRQDNGVGTVTLRRPERLNAINQALLSDLHEAMTRANDDPECGVILLHGEGRAFCAGDDLRDETLSADTDAAGRHIAEIQQITRDLMLNDKIVVGAVHGYAVGGGFEWMLNCDLVVAADDLVAFFPETEWGFFVTGGVTHLLPLAVGYQRAMELVVLGDRLDAARLAKLGLVNRVVPGERLMTAAIEMAHRVLDKAPHSVSTCKKVMSHGFRGALLEALEAEEAATVACFLDPETPKRVQRFGKD